MSLSDHSKRRPKICFQDRLSLNAGQKYCRMLQQSILQYFWPSLTYHLSLRPLFCLLFSGCSRQVLLYSYIGLLAIQPLREKCMRKMMALSFDTLQWGMVFLIFYLSRRTDRLVWAFIVLIYLKMFYLTKWWYFFCGSFVLFMSCVCHAFASVHCCLVVTCWERADLLALVYDV